MSIAKALCKPTSEIVSQRLQTVVQEQMAAGYMAAALKQLELSEHDILVICLIIIIILLLLWLLFLSSQMQFEAGI